MNTPSVRARQLCDALVGRRSGIISAVNTVPGIDGDAPLHFAAARIAQPHRMGPDYAGANTGGVGATPDEAIIAALAEGVERYCAASCPPPPYPVRADAPSSAAGSVIIRARMCDLDASALDPMQIAAFSSVQYRTRGFPFHAVNDRTPLHWVRVRSLYADTRLWLPAAACFLPWIAPDEPPILPAMSTGLACADSPAQALRHALCELIERDAVSLTWLGGVTPPRLADALVRDLASELLPPRDRVDAFNLTSDLGIPVFMVLCHGTGPQGSLIAAGTGADPDPALALRRAAREASQTRVYVRQLIAADPGWYLQPHFANVNTFAQHARLYSQRPRLAEQAFAFLARAPAQASLPPHGPEPLDALQRHHFPGAVIDLTQPWTASAGLHVIRACVPALFPLHALHTLPPLGHPRLAALARALPHGVIRHDRDLWPCPHPFA